MEHELSKLYPPDRKVRIAGRDVEIKPLTLRQFGGVAAMVKQIAPSGLFEFNVASMLADHSATMAQILQIATGIDADVILDAQPDEALLLATEVLEVNADFFEDRLAPLISRIIGRVGTSQASGAGPTQSPTSTGQASTTPVR